MIIFDKNKYITDIMRNGIKENDSRANYKLFLAAKFLIEKTKYRDSIIKQNLKKYSKEYFRGLAEPIIDKEIENYICRAKASSIIEVKKKGINNSNNSDSNKNLIEPIKFFELKHINLYVGELKRIAELDEDLRELAFAFLVINKFQGYKWTYECNSDIYKVCHWNEKGSGKSQTTKNKLIHRLVKNNIVKFYCHTNSAYRFDKSWIAKTSFTVLINEDHFDERKIRSSIWKTITNYDDVLLYWRLYNGDSNIKLCAECEEPIERTSNSKKLCYNCALKNIKKSKKRNKEMASKITN